MKVDGGKCLVCMLAGMSVVGAYLCKILLVLVASRIFVAERGKRRVREWSFAFVGNFVVEVLASKE